MAARKPAATKEKGKTPDVQTAPQEAPAAQLPSVLKQRLPYPKSLQEYAQIGAREWQVLTDVVFPNATTLESVVLAVQYCHARKLDIFKKVVHIVPMRRKTGKTGNNGKPIYENVDTIWPGIAEVRITATRTKVYAGKDEAVFGPLKKRLFQKIDDRNGEPVVTAELELEFPEWCQLTVYKIVQGIRCAFVGPKVYWEEAYATESFFSEIPNEMWRDRRNGQLEKCAEAASLRAAFPEELGGEYTAEEMHGRVIDGNSQIATAPSEPSATMTPARPKESEFRREPEKKPEPVQGKPDRANATDVKPEPEGDQRPVPPVGEESQEEDIDEDTPPTAAFVEAREMLDKYLPTMKETPDLDDFKNQGWVALNSFTGMTDKERSALGGELNTVVLTEQRARAKKKK